MPFCVAYCARRPPPPLGLVPGLNDLCLQLKSPLITVCSSGARDITYSRVLGCPGSLYTFSI
jgi:hypothetical protein